MHRHRILPLLALTALVTACAEAPTSTESQLDRVGGPMLSAAADESAQHMVVFNSKAPADFAQRVAAFGGTVELNHAIGIAIVSGLSAENAPKLQAQIGAQYVEAMPDFQLVQPAEIGEPELQAMDVLTDELASVANPASALGFAQQWNMTLVKAPAAWAAGHLGNAGVRVAILDTGIDYLLPDLNGLVDLSRSASFVPYDDKAVQAFYPTRHKSTDLHYHGTNVATQVSSKAVYYAGVTSKTTLMSVKVCSYAGGCPGVTKGILYAVDNGADVINMSLGGWFTKSAYPGTVSAYNRIMNYAKQKGVTIVVSAGNSAIDLDRDVNVPITDSTGAIVARVHVPSLFASYCNATHVICVSSVRKNDVAATYTNYGRSAIDVSAPGGGSGDFVRALCPQTSRLYNCSAGLYSLGVAGTSQAAPHVSGLAALAVQQVGRNPAEVKALIRDSADLIDGGNTPYHGKGRINVARLVGAN